MRTAAPSSSTSRSLSRAAPSREPVRSPARSTTPAARCGPGLSPGQLTETGAYTQASGGAFNVEIGGLTVGSQYDRLAISGAATLGGALNISLYGGYEPDLGDTFTIMTFGSRSGDFATVTGSNIGNGKMFQKTVNATSVVLQVVPEATPTATVTATGTATGTATVTATNTATATATRTQHRNRHADGDRDAHRDADRDADAGGRLPGDAARRLLRRRQERHQRQGQPRPEQAAAEMEVGQRGLGDAAVRLRHPGPQHQLRPVRV